MTSTTQKTIILKRCGPCPDFASLTLAFALQLRKNWHNLSLLIMSTMCSKQVGS